MLSEIWVDARPIAAARIGLGLASILNALEMVGLLGGIARGKVALPVASWLPAPTGHAVLVYSVLAVGAGIALTVGFRPSIAAAVTTVLNVSVFLWDQQTYSSHRLLTTVLVACLIFARSDSAWSVSARRRGSTVSVPWWPQLLMMVEISTCYAFAALSKINPAFLSGVPLESWTRVALPTWVFPVIAAGTVVTEIFLAVGFWLRRTRLLAAVAGLALHLSIVVTLADNTLPLVAFMLACVPMYGLFLTRPTIDPVGQARIVQTV